MFVCAVLMLLPLPLCFMWLNIDISYTLVFDVVVVVVVDSVNFLLLRLFFIALCQFDGVKCTSKIENVKYTRTDGRRMGARCTYV